MGLFKSIGTAVGGVVGGIPGAIAGGLTGKLAGQKVGGLLGGSAGGGTIAPISVEQSRRDIETDIQRGERSGNITFAEGKLGRLRGSRSEDVRSAIEARRAALGGISAQENQALRERSTQGIDRGTQTALRQLRGRQGASGVRGGLAGTQQANVLAAGQQAKANVERDLLIKNIEAKRQAVGDFEASVTGAETIEQERSVFNIGQQNKETFGRLSSGLGFAQLGVQERAAARGVAVAGSNVQAASQGGKI